MDMKSLDLKRVWVRVCSSVVVRVVWVLMLMVVMIYFSWDMVE